MSAEGTMPIESLDLPLDFEEGPQPRTEAGRAFLEWIGGYSGDVPFQDCWVAVLNIENEAMEKRAIEADL